MIALLNAQELREGLIVYLILVIGLSVHEWAHAWTADRLGDSTPREHGRVTLNPLSHADPLGTVGLPLLMLLLSSAVPGFILFGWARPVPVDPANFRRPVRDHVLVTLAGPFSNVLLCLVSAVVGGVLVRFVPDAGLERIVMAFISMNALLAVLNLIPLPPLDGSHLARHAFRMSADAYRRYALIGLVGMVVLAAVLINVPAAKSGFSMCVGKVASPFVHLMQLIGN